MSLKPEHALGGAGLLLALGAAYLATRAAGPVGMKQFTEVRAGPLQEHLVTEAELIGQPVYVPQHYPARVSPQITRCITHGFAPQYRTDDPVIEALRPAAAW